MADYDLSIHRNPKADAWVEFFRKCNHDCNVSDEMMMIWFSNAMMAMHDFLVYGKAPINGDHAQAILDGEA